MGGKLATSSGQGEEEEGAGEVVEERKTTTMWLLLGPVAMPHVAEREMVPTRDGGWRHVAHGNNGPVYYLGDGTTYSTKQGALEEMLKRWTMLQENATRVIATIHQELGKEDK